MYKNKFNIPIYKNVNVFNISENSIDHYTTFDDSIWYRRTLNRYNPTGILLRKFNKIENP